MNNIHNYTFFSVLSFCLFAFGEATASEHAEKEKQWQKYTEITVSSDLDGKEIKATMSREDKENFYSQMHSISEKGYMEKLNQPPKVDYIINRIKEFKAIKSGNNKDLSEAIGHESYQEITGNSGLVDFNKLSFYPTLVSNKHLESDTESYLIGSPHRVQQIHTKSKKFGSILVDELRGLSSSVIHEPNSELAGYPAKIVSTKHAKGAWSTTIVVNLEESAYILEVNRRLNKPRLAELEDMLEEMIYNRVE